MIDKPPALKPKPEDWKFFGFTPFGQAWQHASGIAAISSVVWVGDEHQPEKHWEYLVSFSMAGQRALTESELKRAIKDWEMESFEEDNHEPGIARKFWLAVDPSFRKPCPCKEEETIVSGDYRYQKDRSEL